jgi:hypothetical protein
MNEVFFQHIFAIAPELSLMQVCLLATLMGKKPFFSISMVKSEDPQTIRKQTRVLDSSGIFTMSVLNKIMKELRGVTSRDDMFETIAKNAVKITAIL